MGVCSGAKGYPSWIKGMPPWLNFSSSLISIIGSSIMIFMYFYNKSKEDRKQTNRKLIFYLSISDLIASTSIFISQGQKKKKFWRIIKKKKNHDNMMEN